MTDPSDADPDPLRAPPGERSVPELLRFGVVNLDKPAGPSSHQVSAWVRDAIDETLATLDPEGPPTRGVAHSGTLDPKVTGCLPTLTGDATRMAQVFLEGAKEYVAVLELHGSPPSDFREVVAEFEGEIYQKPPRKSAVSRRLRTRTVHELDLLEVADRRALLRIRCESGTYVRKLCHDIGLATGGGAHMGHLRRSATDPFDDRDLRTLQDLVDALAWAGDGDDALLREVVRPAEDALAHLPAVTVARSAARSVATGAPVYAPGVIDVDDAAIPAAVRDDASTDSDAPTDTDGDAPTDTDGDAPTDRDTDPDPPLAACFTPDGTAVCLGRIVGDPDAENGTVVALERVLL
ncbi:tRNA pseudouridine(55) synthase TruB [Halorubrum ezzemoulense]|uniref:Probable tRNA pseudouridine synthase B n=1 Tax=Halorubrum ezzemoulense TaxID=337243 RepID=A0A256IQQ5_HALEZ|nr:MULTISPECIES: RNA-guided pseudouridylation complex pseudouridine synthase subunit Cbf5 [Halorubrum]OYR58845.1 tRNA pseudouridine(55) synthase TruB [Halorubrum ezzemoulense]OYR66250.1 tRNA pseudouridine(55) synthase TruB [Halorubrum ezzemoulense]OYR77550.1 tRNA pseudouridine(55) synthase TruB [Halorubrum ezzemoulense]OYR79166.1 tRNA pseudouridine(55) synthase TruB [Halorubrum ezzemoulense]PHQ41274.1 tRNA pseudouridine(55) synthase TruB [Halorubrum sp. C191]